MVVRYLSRLYYVHSNNKLKKGVSIITQLTPNLFDYNNALRPVAKAMEDQVINVAFAEKGNGYSPLPAAQWVKSLLEMVSYQEIQLWLDFSQTHPEWGYAVSAGVDTRGNWFLQLKNWEDYQPNWDI